MDGNELPLDPRHIGVPLGVQAQKSFWTHPMVLHRDVVQLEARLGSFGDNVNLDATQVHSFALNVK
jgi:hypothetical protein